jgi:hypothetical protein
MSLREIAMSRLLRRPSTPSQLDLFGTGAPPPLAGVPNWTALPDQTRRTLTGLVTRMLIAHAGAAALEPTGDVDDV